MSDNTNINENEAVKDNAASESKEQNAAVDAAQLAYLVYARKYRKKLQADKKKTEKKTEDADAAALGNANAAEIQQDSSAAVEKTPEPALQENAQLENESSAQSAEENNNEPLEQIDEIENEENTECEPAMAEPVGEALPEEEIFSPAAELETAPEAEFETVPESAVDDSNMIISIDPEAKKKNTLDGIDMDLNIEPEENKNTLDGVDMELDLVELAEAPMTNNSGFGGFGVPAPTPVQMPNDNDGGKIMLNIEEQIKEDENLLNINARVFPVEAFDSLVRERDALAKILDDHYRAYAEEMERLRQKHLYLQMDATARAAAEHDEEFKLLQKEEERYKQEVDELSRRRDEAAKEYLERKADLEGILDEYEARNADLNDAGSAIQKIAADAASVTAQIAGGLAGAGFAGAASPNAQLEHERAMAAAVLEKEKAQAEARVEAEKRAAAEAKLEAERAAAELKIEKAKAEALSQYSKERAAAEAKINELERDAAKKAAVANAKNESLNDAKSDAEKISRELEKKENAGRGQHVIVPGAIDRARAEAEEREKYSETRVKPQKSNITNDTLPAYLAAVQRDLAELDREYSAIEAEKPRNHEERVDNSVAKLDVRRRVVEKMTDKLLACRDAGASTSMCEKHRDELRQAVAQYNASADECGALLGVEIMRAEPDMAERVLRGDDYRKLPVVLSKGGAATLEDGSSVEKIKNYGQDAVSEDAIGEIDDGLSENVDALNGTEGVEPISRRANITSLAGLSKKEAKEMLKAEKEALKAEAFALAESSKENARKSKEAAKLAKRGDKASRKKYKADAVEFANQSAADEKLAKEKARTEKELKSLKDYEKYLGGRSAELDAAAINPKTESTADYDSAVSKKLKKANETSDYEDYREFYRKDGNQSKPDSAELKKQLSEYRDQRKKKASVDLKNLPAYLTVVGKDMAALDREYKVLESHKPKARAESVENVVERLGNRRRSVEKATDKLLACRSAGAPAVISERHKGELDEAVARYNAVVDEYRLLTGHSLTRAESDMADRVLRGEDYQLLPVITSRREIVSKEDGSPVNKALPSELEAAPLKVDTVVGGEHQLADDAAVKKAATASVVMTERDIPKFLKQQKIKEAKLRERDIALSEIETVTTEDKVVVTVERLGTQRELVTSLSKDLKLAVAIGDKRKIRSYKKQLTTHINKYNRLADRYKRITGDTLTRADENIPEYIESGAQYKALPVISYRKESPDGKLLSDKRGAGVTLGAAYALIPEDKRRALERRGVIDKTRATSITGLSKKEASSKLKAEKAALKAEAAELAELSRENAKKSKEASKYAKRGAKDERSKYKARAIEYANRSAFEDARSKELLKTEKELKTLKDYEEYLLERELPDGIIAKAEPGKSAYAESTSEKLAKPTAQALEYEAYKVLSKREKREKLKEEKSALFAEAKACEQNAALDLAKSKEEKKLSKSGTRAERAEHRLQSEMLKKSAAGSAESAKNAKKTAKSLKNESDFERYLAGRAERAEILRQESEMAKSSVSGAKEATAPVAAAKDYGKYSKKDTVKAAQAQHSASALAGLSSREKKLRLAEERRSLNDVADALDAEAKATEKSAKAAKAQSKQGSRYERAEAKAEANELAVLSAEQKRRADETRKTAKSLKTVGDYERYLATRDVDKKAAAESIRSAERIALNEGAGEPSQSELESFKKLSKREKQEKLREEKLALLAEAREYDEEAAFAAEAAKREKKLAKTGTRSERAAHKADAEKLERKSEEYSKASKKSAAAARGLTGLAAYEKYLAAKEYVQFSSKTTDNIGDEYERYLEKQEMLKEAKASKTPSVIDDVSLVGLSKSEKKALLAKEREELLKNAAQLEAESKTSEDSAKKAKKQSKSGTRRDRAEARAEAKELIELSASQKLQAKENRKTAKSLKTVSDYEKYLAAKSQIVEEAATDRELAEKETVNTELFDKKMSKRELRAEAKRRSLEFEQEAKRLDREAKEEERLAKEERRLAKAAKRAERPIHESEADALESHSQELRSKAETARIEALELKELKTLKAFEQYNAKKEALAAEKMLAGGVAERGRADFFDADRLIKHNRAAIESFCHEQTENDERMLKARYETRIARAKSDLEIKKLHFGEKNGKYKRSCAALNKELASVEAHISRAIKAERRDNERYYAVVKTNVENMKLPRGADKAKLTGLQVEIEALLKERDAVNRELTALYNSNKKAGDGKNNTYERLKSATKGAKSAYKKQRKLANEIDALHIPLDEKKKIFDPMNRITQINAEINDLAYRIEREKLKGRAKSAAISGIKKKKKERAYLERNIKALSNKAKKKAYIESRERKSQAAWIVVLVLAIAAGVAVWYFRADIYAYLMSLIKSFLPESVSAVLDSVLGGGNNG